MARIFPVPADISSASPLRPRQLAWTRGQRFVAHLLFRTGLSSSDLVLEGTMEIGRLAKPDHLCDSFSDGTLAGVAKGLFLRRDLQPKARHHFRRRPPEMAGESLWQKKPQLNDR